jgi:hypothetical protein
VSEFISEQFAETFPPGNDMIVILRDLFVARANDRPMIVLKTIQQFNFAVVEFSQKDRTKEYINKLTRTGKPVPDLPDGGAGREI